MPMTDSLFGERRWLDGCAKSDPNQCECRDWGRIRFVEGEHHPRCVAGLSMWENQCDYVIAFSAKDADNVCAEMSGFSHAQENGEAPEDAWTRVPDDKLWTLHDMDEPGQESQRRAAAEWVRRTGRAYHSCTEY